MPTSATVRRLAAVLLWAATAVAAQTPPEELFGDGIEAFEAGLYEVAARNFRALLDSAPGAREAVPASFLEALSRFYAATGTGDVETAAAAAARFAAHQRQFPDTPYGDQIWYWIGAARLAAGDAEGALGALQQHLSEPDADSRKYLLLAREAEARALEQLGRGAEALERYEGLLAAADTSPDPAAGARWLERSGVLLLAQGRYAAATERFRRIFTDHPQSPQAQEALFFVAEAQYFAREFAAATAGYRRYLEFFPDAAHRGTASFRLARLLLDAGDLAGARRLTEWLAAGVHATGAARGRGAAPGPADDPAAVALLSGDVAAASADWRAAVLAYEEGLAVATAPDQRQVLAMNLALAQVETAVPLQAIVNFEEAAAGPDSTIAESALYNRALLLVGDGKLTAAAAALGRFLERFPDSEHRAAAEALLLSVQERAGNHRGMLETLDRMAARRRLTAQERQRRGTALLWLGEDIAALETLAHSAEELPPAARAESQYRIGAVYARRGEHARAAPFFSAALEQAGADGELRRRAGYALAVTHFNTGEYGLALVLLEEVTDTAGGKWLADGRFAQGATLYRLGRSREAAAHFGLAAAAYAVPHPPERSPERSPEDAGAAEAARGWQALALFRAGDWEPARSVFRELARSAAADQGLHWYRAGLASGLLHDLAAAERELLSALGAVPDEDPLRPAIHYELARLHLTAGELETAADWLQRLETAFPDHRLTAIGRLRRADTLRDLGRLREAADAYLASAARGGGQREDWAAGVAELARYSLLEVLEELADVTGMLEAAWGYLLHHPSGSRAEQVAARLQAALAAADPDTAQDYYRRATAATAAAEVPAAVAAPVRLAYAEVLLERDPSAAERVLREQLQAPSSDDVRSAALLLLGRAFETGGRWDEAESLYRGLALAERAAVAGLGALGVARVLAGSGDAAAAAEEYGAVAVRFAEQPEVAAEAWYRGALAHRDAGDREAATLFVRRLGERFPASSWARRAAEEFSAS